MSTSTLAAPVQQRPRVAGAFLLLFLIGAETFLLSPLLPSITAGLDTDVHTAANATTAYVVVYAVASPFLGSLSDRIGRRIPLVVGAGLFLVANLVCAIAPDVGILITARAVGGLGAALAGPSLWAYLADSASDDHEVGRLMGRGMAFFSSGQVIGIPVGAGIAALTNWRWSFAVLGIGTVIALVSLSLAVSRSARATAPPSLIDGLKVALVPSIARILAVTAIVQLFSLGTYAYVGQILHDRLGWDTAALGLVGVLVGLGSVGGSLLAGRLSRSSMPSPLRRVLWIVVISVGVVLFASAHVTIVALIAVFAWFVGSGGFVTEQQTALALAAGERKAAASAWNTSSMHAGTAVGVVLIGAALPEAAVVSAIVGGLVALAVTFVSSRWAIR